MWARETEGEEIDAPNSVPIEHRATYFSVDILYSKKELNYAPSDVATGGDVFSFGIQRFKVVLEGIPKHVDDDPIDSYGPNLRLI